MRSPILFAAIGILALAARPPVLNAQSVLLEDFSSMRTNGVTPAVCNSTTNNNDNSNCLWPGNAGEGPTSCWITGNNTLSCFTQGAAPFGLSWWFAPLDCDNSGCYSDQPSYIKGRFRSGTWNVNLNRLRWTYRCSTSVAAVNPTGGGHWLEIGDYVRALAEPDPAESGQGQHYYHYLNQPSQANEWVYVELTRKAQHRVGDSGSADHPNDPEWTAPTQTIPVHYYDGMTHFYFGPTYANELRASGVSCEVGPYTLTLESGMPEDYVSSISGAYNASSGKYDVSWSSPKNIPGGLQYDIRYSTSSMRTIGFSSGSNGGSITGQDDSPNTNIVYSTPSVARATNMYIGMRPHIPIWTVTSTSPVTIQTFSPNNRHWLTTGDQVTIQNLCATANGTRTVTVIDDFTVSLGVSGACSYAGYTGNGSGQMIATSSTTNFMEFLIGPGGGSGTAPTITSTSPLPAGTLGVPYSFTFTATGTTPIAWSATGLPGWASLSSSGVLTGTPNAAATSTLQVTATNSVGATGPIAFSLTINGGPPVITSTSPLPSGTMGTAYSFQFAATGGAPITWTGTGLPGWASLSAGGLLSGTPNDYSLYTIHITATNGGGSAGPTDFSLPINPTLPVYISGFGTAMQTMSNAIIKIPQPKIVLTAQHIPSNLNWVNTGQGSCDPAATSGPTICGFNNVAKMNAYTDALARAGVKGLDMNLDLLVFSAATQYTGSIATDCPSGWRCKSLANLDAMVAHAIGAGMTIKFRPSMANIVTPCGLTSSSNEAATEACIKPLEVAAAAHFGSSLASMTILHEAVGAFGTEMPMPITVSFIHTLLVNTATALHAQNPSLKTGAAAETMFNADAPFFTDYLTISQLDYVGVDLYGSSCDVRQYNSTAVAKLANWGALGVSASKPLYVEEASPPRFLPINCTTPGEQFSFEGEGGIDWSTSGTFATFLQDVVRAASAYSYGSFSLFPSPVLIWATSDIANSFMTSGTYVGSAMQHLSENTIAGTTYGRSSGWFNASAQGKVSTTGNARIGN